MELYPKPRIPDRPVHSLRSFVLRDARARHTVLDAGEHLPVTSGRSAIALALRYLNVGAGSEVLVPAYHCSSMVSPIVWLGAKPVFYRINPDLSVDLEDLKRKISGTTKAMLLVHYFGFPQELGAARQLCDELEIALIEDCAHAFFGSSGDKGYGTVGDFAIASAMKFFPVFDGGYLISPRHRLTALNTSRAGLAFQLKAVFDRVEYALGYQRYGAFNALLGAPLWLKNRLWRLMRAHEQSGTTADIGPAASRQGFEFEPAWADKDMSIASKLLMRVIAKDRVAELRRENYRRLHTELSGLPGGRPVYAALPEQVVPYVFPFLVDDPQRVHPMLKRRGVPIYRWEEFFPGVDPQTCPVSARYSQQLLQFPCHQALYAKEIDWMVSEIRLALRAG